MAKDPPLSWNCLAMIETHPYGEFIPSRPKAMIIGTFPIGKFSHPERRHEIKPHEFNFFFGGEKNLLWKLLAHAFKKELRTTADIIFMLKEHGLAIGDVIKSCRRENGGGSDSDLFDIVWNKPLLAKIRKHNIKILFFTSRKVEKWFNQLFPETDDLKKISLISPSGQSIRGLARNQAFIRWRLKHPDEKAVEFIYAEYRKIFLRFLRD